MDNNQLNQPTNNNKFDVHQASDPNLNNMLSKRLFVALVLLAAVSLGFYYIGFDILTSWFLPMAEKDLGEQQIMVQKTAGKKWMIEMTQAGFAPSTLEIEVGDTVEFVNKDSSPHWPASGMHPTHLLCPGFDSLKGMNQNETYSFMFNVAKDCPMHDHLNAALRGMISVKDKTMMMPVGSSDDVSDIEKDLNATDVNDLDKELKDIDAQF